MPVKFKTKKSKPGPHRSYHKEIPVGHPALLSWGALNAELMITKTEEGVRKLLNLEQEGRRRTLFLKRILGRVNRVRRDRERAELGL